MLMGWFGVRVIAVEMTDQKHNCNDGLDVVIKTRRRDLATFLRLQEDVLKHSGLKGRVYVFVPRGQLALFKPIVDSSFLLIPTDEVLRIFGFEGDFEDSWLTQQIIKILAVRVVANEQYLMLDSNTLLNYDFDETVFRRGMDYLYAIGYYNNVEWELQSRNLLQLNGSGELFGFRDVNQVFLKANVIPMIEHLERMYKQNIIEILLAYSNDRMTNYWTEFSLYGVFCVSRKETCGHYFEETNDVSYFVKTKVDLDRFLLRIRNERPLMIKVHKHRPMYYMNDDEYSDVVSRIKAAYTQ